MKNLALICLASLLYSCVQKEHDFVFGEYARQWYWQGELQEIDQEDVYNGVVSNDSLFLSKSSFISNISYLGYKPKTMSCANDTAVFIEHIISIPLKKEYNELVSRSTLVITKRYINGIVIDTCLRESGSSTLRFKVTEDYIEVMACPNCGPQEVSSDYYLRPKLE